MDLPEELQVLEGVIGNDDLEIFNFDIDTFSDIEALVIVLADDNNEISIYKKLSPIEILGVVGICCGSQINDLNVLISNY